MPTLQFKGKSVIWNHHLSVPYHTLEEDKKLSFQPEKGEGNLIIEGDNLIALKALLPEYSGKIKCIYIDPPYNTGKEGWIYNDSVNSPLIKEWLGDEVGLDDMTRHDKWLCMMVPRLKLLRELLADEGVIIVSIDDNELFHLKTIMDEIFVESNFIGNMIWHTATDNNPRQIAVEHEYILFYAKDKNRHDSWEIPTEKGKLIQTKYEELKRRMGKDLEGIQFELRKWIKSQIDDGVDLSGVSHYSYVDKKGVYYPGNSSNTRPGGYMYDIVHPRTKRVCGKPDYGYRFAEDTFWAAEKEGDVLWGEDESIIPKIKKRLETATEQLKSYYYEDNRATTNQLKELFDGKKVFDNPKSGNLLRHILSFITSDTDFILDSFAGSGTTMHAVMDLNKEDDGNRKCILVQMTESTGKEPKKNICRDITQERIRRAIKKNGYESGFKYFRVGEAIDAETMLSGKLPTYIQLAKYAHYLCTGSHVQDEKKIDEKTYFVGSTTNERIYLIYDNDYEKLVHLALNLDLAERFLKESTGKKIVVYAPACFLEEEYMAEKRIEFVSIPYNLFTKNK
jgi:adenine-specific DNA-methyltransferase